MATLRERLEQKKNQIGLIGTRLNFSRPSDGKGVSEHITHDWRELVIRIRDDINLAPDDATKNYLRARGVSDPVETIATDLLYHGCGHRELPVYTGRGCPYTVANHDLIMDGIAQGLKEKGKSGLESYLSNAFEDVLDNTNARRHTTHTGQILFWNNEGLESDAEKYPAFYEAFVKINLALMGSAVDATLLKRFYTHDEKVQTAVQQFTTYLKQKMGVRHLVKSYEKEDVMRKLFDKTSWREMAYQFALATADLLEDQPTMRLCFGLPPDGNPFDKEMKLPGTQEELAYGRYKEGLGPSEHTDPLLQFDALYRRISKAIPVQTSEYTRSSGIPIAYFGRRDLREDETIRIRRMKGIGFDEKGDLTVRMARHELKHPAKYKVHPRKFPKLKVALIDTSSSMGCNPDNETDGAGNPINVGDTSFIPWGDGSKYHFTLKGLYGIDNFLERQGIANYVESEVITFSGSTQRTGRGKLHREEERRALLRKPSGGTSIDTAVLQNATGEKCFLVSISDGDVQNWSGVEESYKKAIEGTDYCHIHIGSANEFTRDLESWGIPVSFVKGDDDLSKLLLNLTSTYYKNGNFN